MSLIDDLRKQFNLLTLVQKQALLGDLNAQQQSALLAHPDLFLFDKQIINGNDWRYYILMCGRAFGKTFAGSAWIAKKIHEGAKVVGLCGATYSDVADVMVPAIQSWFPANSTNYNHHRHLLELPNGSKCYCYSSDTEIRGPNLEYCWCDEIAKWCDSIPEKVKETFEVLDYAVRAGQHPQTIVTTTPKSFPLLADWKEAAKTPGSIYKIVSGWMGDNPTLPQEYVQAMIQKYGNTRLGRQELYGELLLDTPGALWHPDLLDANRMPTPSQKDGFQIYRIVIGVDPAISSGNASDETGIVVAGLAENGEIYVLEDKSGQYSPDKWSNIVNDLYDKYQADCIIAEKNQGGELVSYTLHTVNQYLPVKLVHAKKGKITRAEPVAALYEQKKVHHTTYFHELEKQMTSYTGDPKQASPDRLDALVYAITELVFTQTSQQRDFTNLGFY